MYVFPRLQAGSYRGAYLCRTVRRNGDSPDKAVRFSNLYARLLTQPVLSQKWGILYLLHQLADSTDDNGIQRNANDSLNGGGRRRASNPFDSDGETFRDAFAGRGLPQHLSPEKKADPTQNRVNLKDRDRRKRRDTQPEENGVALPDHDMEKTSEGPSEAALLRDLPYTLQGLSTTNLQFSSSGTLDLPTTLPLPIISILHTLAEPSLLYRSLSDFVESHNEGLIGQSLRSAIAIELRSYLGLISTLESEIRRAISSVENIDHKRGVGKAGVTLKRCVVWTRDATMGLRLMSVMVEQAKSRQTLRSV